jgi:hypothetical protein
VKEPIPRRPAADGAMLPPEATWMFGAAEIETRPEVEVRPLPAGALVADETVGPGTNRDTLRERIAKAIADALKPRYGGPQHNTPGGLPLTATAEEARLHRAWPLADAVLAVLPAPTDQTAAEERLGEELDAAAETIANRTVQNRKLEDDLATARATNQRLNLRAQQLESELAAYRRAVAQWEIDERGTYIPHASLRAIGLACGRDILGSVRHLKHFERVEQAETAIEEHRLALSEALDLGTGAPWDAIHERVAELRRLAGEAHRCGNCEGIDPASCLANPARAAQQDPTQDGMTPVGGVKGNPFDYHPEDAAAPARSGQPETEEEEEPL